MNIGSTGGSAAGSGRRWRRLAILSVALISFGTIEALGVGLYYEMQRVRLKDWASRDGNLDQVQYPAFDSPPCPNRMQAPTCLAAATATATATNDSDSDRDRDRDAILDLLVIRKSDSPSVISLPAQAGQPETTSDPERFEAVKTPEAP